MLFGLIGRISKLLWVCHLIGLLMVSLVIFLLRWSIWFGGYYDVEL